MTVPASHRRWFYPRLNWILFALLGIGGFLLISEQAGWFGFDEDKLSPLIINLEAGIVLLLLVFFWSWSRRRFQFSLRTLLAVVTLCAVLCSWLAVKMRQSSRERAAAEAIETMGGGVVWSRPRAAIWLWGLLRDGPFANVVGVSLGKTQDVDAALKHLKGLSHLQSLDLADTSVTDDELEALEGLNELRVVYLYSTKVTDKGVKKLEQALPKCTIQLNPDVP